MTNEEFIQSITLPGEEWRDVPGLSDVCMASSEGRIISKGRLVKSGYGTSKWKQPKIQTARPDKHGYCSVNVSRLGKSTPMLVHRLVAMAFIPNPDNKPAIDHIDGTRDNNRASNLRWCTPSENMLNPITRKRTSKQSSERSRPEKYRPVVAIKDGIVVKSYQSAKFAIKDGFSDASIYQACIGKRKTYRGMIWMYLSDYESLVQYIKELKLDPNDSMN